MCNICSTLTSISKCVKLFKFDALKTYFRNEHTLEWQVSTVRSCHVLLYKEIKRKLCKQKIAWGCGYALKRQC